MVAEYCCEGYLPFDEEFGIFEDCLVMSEGNTHTGLGNLHFERQELSLR